jgi:cell division septation protein DedD
VVAVGTDRVIGTTRTAWRSDLPAVAPDGEIALLRSKDVVLVDGETLRPRRSITGGARDQWYFIGWNGFRPRAAGLDEPVEFPEYEEPVDTGVRAGADTVRQDPAEGRVTTPSLATVDSMRRAAQAAADSARRTATGFTVQFGALRSQAAARELAQSIRVEGAVARVATTVTGGIPIHRVIVGPFATRAQAERVAKTSNRSFWIYEGTP